MKKRAVIFILAVCFVTVYTIVSADQYFQINNLKRQMELSVGSIQSVQTARQEAYHLLLDYYTEYTKDASVTVSALSAGRQASEQSPDAATIQDTLSSFNIQDSRYQEIQLRVVKSEQNLKDAVGRYNDLAEEYNQKIAKPFFYPLRKLLRYEKKELFSLEGETALMSNP